MSNNNDSRELPSGIVTFLFTDIQDSTKLWERPYADLDKG